MSGLPRPLPPAAPPAGRAWLRQRRRLSGASAASASAPVVNEAAAAAAIAAVVAHPPSLGRRLLLRWRRLRVGTRRDIVVGLTLFAVAVAMLLLYRPDTVVAADDSLRAGRLVAIAGGAVALYLCAARALRVWIEAV